MYGTVEWLSHRYPHKRYQAICFSPEMYNTIVSLVDLIEDYHTITATLRFKH